MQYHYGLKIIHLEVRPISMAGLIVFNGPMMLSCNRGEVATGGGDLVPDLLLLVHAMSFKSLGLHLFGLFALCRDLACADGVHPSYTFQLFLNEVTITKKKRKSAKC